MRDIYSETEVYHTLDIVGKGTFGKVAKCWRGSDGELVAVKSMKIDPHKNRVIKNELKLISALSRSSIANCNIVLFYEAFRDENHHYLVFELLEMNLYQFQKENGFRPMAVRYIRTITCQMLKALAKLKEIAIIHADLKPENVMIVDHCRYPYYVKLIDFGSASIYNEVRFVKEPYIQSRFYRSPEILLGLPFCEKVDMWSLGCVMCELFLGWPLYPGESELDQVRYICETLGQPNDSLLNAASKTSKFFKLQKNSRGQSQWEPRPSKRPLTSGQGNGGGGGRRRKYVFSSLDQLVNLDRGSEAGPGQEGEVLQEDVAAEGVDRLSMVDLLKRMLTLGVHERILPSDALKHSFITLTHLGSSPEFGHHSTASRLAYQRACILEKVTLGDGAKGFLSQRKSDVYQLCPEVQPLPHHPSQNLAGLQDDEGRDYNSQHAPRPPSETQTPSELMDELCLEDDISLDDSMGVWAMEAGYDFSSMPVSTSDVSSSLQPSQTSLQSRGPGRPHRGPSTDQPALGPANREDPHKGLPRSFFTRLCENQHLPPQPGARSSRSEPTHGLTQTPETPHDRAGVAGGYHNPPHGGPGTPQDQARAMEQGAQATQPACHYEGPEEVQLLQSGGPQACPCPHWSYPAWASDLELTPCLTHGPECCNPNQHSYLPY
ncbi:homeodomain-interacting protein kinase 4-like [Osmerus eperlanus]|uniref:homeodomain-interacting protein kinase 4-like n=1 Tax=Osmerus eperlanus TaxID=29151 RepID=UPI002E1105C0